MKNRLLLLPFLAVAAANFLAGCSSSGEPEVDKSVPMGSNSDKFKPTQMGAASGNSGRQGGKLGTPGAQ